MLSKIGDFIKPAQSKGETSDKIVERPDYKNRDKGEKKDNAEDEQQDDTLFSIDAIRALLKQENLDAGSEAFAHLDLLQQKGVSSIPIRNGQSIVAAIAAAVAQLR